MAVGRGFICLQRSQVGEADWILVFWEGGTRWDWPELVPGKVWKCPGASLGGSCWKGGGTLAQGQQHWDSHPKMFECLNVWFAFFSGTASGSEGRSGAQKAGGEELVYTILLICTSLSICTILSICTSLQTQQSCRPAPHPAFSPFLEPVSSLDKWLQIAFWRFSCVPEGPRTRPADDFSSMFVLSHILT